MKTINMKAEFGSVCGDGRLALLFLQQEVAPILESQDKICLDFNGVRVLNASFSNAMFGNLIRSKGVEVLKSIKVLNACPIVKSGVKSGISLGLKHKSRKKNARYRSDAG
jgi:hypothetical protein